MLLLWAPSSPGSVEKVANSPGFPGSFPGGPGVLQNTGSLKDLAPSGGAEKLCGCFPLVLGEINAGSLGVFSWLEVRVCGCGVGVECRMVCVWGACGVCVCV